MLACLKKNVNIRFFPELASSKLASEFGKKL